MTRRRTGRGLRASERAIWRAYAAGVEPLMPAERPKDEPEPEPEAAPAPPPKPPAKAPLQISPFRIGEGAAAPTPVQAKADSAMDQRTLEKLRKGRLGIEARLDLHGMTVAEAHAELMGFILNARARGLRLVLVITGKGGISGDGRERGTLRRQVPQWLRLPPLGSIVLESFEAHATHGGGGALYVYLRRLREHRR